MDTSHKPQAAPHHSVIDVEWSKRPPRTIAQRLLLWIGGLGPIGRAPASGTVAVAVAGIPLHLLLTLVFNWPLWGYITFTAVFTLVAVWVHHVGDQILGEKDSRKLVLDELVGYLIAMTAVPATWPWIVTAFLLERAIDIVKVPPANLIERGVSGGWGVVGDDIIAGIYTLAILHALHWLIPMWLGA